MTDKNKNTVLVVDDENSNILALTHILSPEYTVYAAKNGRSAINAAGKYSPDVILLDILMPEMDGYAVITALKNSFKTKNIPIIFISGLSNAEDEEKGLALGAADYIIKPFSPATVKLRIQNQIQILTQIRVINKAMKSLEVASESKSAFLANMSHEIRTPMNAIVSMSELLLNDELKSRQRSYVNDINISAHSLLEIINGILDMSKIETGKMELHPIDYDFDLVMNSIVSIFRVMAQKKGIEFTYEREEKMPKYLFGDDIKLRQILTNLCSNAIKFTEAGYVRLKVTIVDDYIKFEVKDTGKGIREEAMATLFENFVQADGLENREIVGTGLGLAITKSFVELMGGEIAVESKYGVGTTFSVAIPIATGDQDKIKVDKNELIAKRVNAPDAKILVVDDNEFNLKVASGLLNLSQINAEVAFSGFEAINLICQKDYDIIFMDHMMPEMDGVATVEEIRKLGDKYEKIPIVALTANAIQGAREMFLENGFNDYLSKPIDTHKLNDVLIQWLPPQRIVNEAVAESTPAAAPDELPDDFIESISHIKEINTKTAMRGFANVVEMYHNAVKFFTKKLIAQCNEISDYLNSGNQNGFTVTIHAMKSMLAAIGAMELSDSAHKLEDSSRNGDVDYCMEHYPPLQEKLFSLHSALLAIFPNTKVEAPKEKGDEAALAQNIQAALNAVNDFDSDTGAEIIKKLQAYDFGDEINALLENASETLANFRYGDTVKYLNEISTNLLKTGASENG
jgi:signal transduction histidine kinase/HPt (histidine-containing phosphotransfer) domain-containing protein